MRLRRAATGTEAPRRFDPQRGRILHLAPRTILEEDNGATLRMHQVAVGQRLAGLDPRVIALEDRGIRRGSAGRSVPVDGVPYYEVGWREHRSLNGRFADPHDAALLAALVERLRPALIHAPTPYVLGAAALELGRRYQVPVVYEVRRFPEDAWLTREPGASTASERYDRERQADTNVMLSADAVVTLGDAMKAEIVSRGIPDDRVVVVPNAVDATRLLPGPRDPVIAEQLGLAAHEIAVGYISVFQPYEDIATLISSIVMLREAGHPVRGIIVGSGQQDQVIRELVANAGMTDAISMPGHIAHAEIARWYRTIDIFVIPRRHDRISELVTPLKPLEAMAAGRPIVFSRLPALAEIMRDGETGIAYEPGDAANLARVIEELIAQPERRTALGVSAREWVVAERTFEANGHRYRGLYERLSAA